MSKTKRLALLGFGNVGKAFAQMLLDKGQEIKDKYGYEIIVTAIATNTKGNLVAPQGIDLAEVLKDMETHGKFCKEAQLTDMSTMDIVNKAEYDVAVELTPLNIFTGQPAIDHIEAAFRRHKDVITANKGPIAWKFAKLRDMAKAQNVKFFYETTVMDGTPVFNMVEKTLQMAKVTEVSGILNTTTNFILEELAAGADYDDIMDRGREMGFVEADPAMDIEGYDATAKVTALLNVMMDADITPDMVDRKGIEDITVDDIKRAAERGCVIKLVCKGYRDADGSVVASVKPEEVPKGHMLAAIDSTTSVVSITTDLMKTVSIVEHQPEIEQTAYGVFSDMLRILSE